MRGALTGFFIGMACAASAQFTGEIHFEVTVLEAPAEGVDYLPSEVRLMVDPEGQIRVEERGTDVDRVWLQTSPQSYAVLFAFLGHQVALVEDCPPDHSGSVCFWPEFPGIGADTIAFEVQDGPTRYALRETHRAPRSARSMRTVDFTIPSAFARVDRSTLGAMLSTLRPE